MSDLHLLMIVGATCALLAAVVGAKLQEYATARALRGRIRSAETALASSAVALGSEDPAPLPPASEPPQGVRRKIEFDTSTSRPVMPAVAADRFAAWMRQNKFTEHLWVGEIDECYLWFCREENLLPVEAKALRELLYRLPGVSVGRPRIDGAAWARYRRRMTDWHDQRGRHAPERPTVVRILPEDMVPSTRVSTQPLVAGHGSGRARPGAAGGRKALKPNVDSVVRQRPSALPLAFDEAA